MKKFSFKKVLLEGIRVAVITAICGFTCVLLASLYHVQASDSLNVLAHYMWEHAGMYLQGIAGASLFSLLLIFAYYAEWTKVHELLRDDAETPILIITALIFIHGIFQGVMVSYITPRIPGFDSVYLVPALAFLYGIFGRGYAIVYTLTTIGFVIFGTGDFVGSLVVYGLLTVIPAGLGYLLNRGYYLLFVKKYSFEKEG